MEQDRNEALEFARRTKRNLDFIERARDKGEDVHVVTQLTLSLLGLIVFPKEKLLLAETKTKTLDAMADEGWPLWSITLDNEKKRTVTLADLIRHIRNAVAHGRLTFNSDSRSIEDVVIVVEDKHDQRDTIPSWSARIGANDLRRFCLRFLDFIDDTIG